MTLLRTGCALIALVVPTPALAQIPSADELATLVRAQAAEIAALKARLDRLEGAQQVAAMPAPATPGTVAPTSASAPAPVQVAQQTRRPQVTAPFAPVA